jgi:Fur family ferric uptake transcriptional regulator
MDDKAGVAATRTTRQAAAVWAILADSAAFRSAQDIHAELHRRGEPVGLSTVYRRLQALAEAKTVDVLYTPEGEAVYRRCGSGRHHHHLVCRECGRTVEVESRQVERWAQRVAEEQGFVDVDHTVEVFGICATCAPAG